MSSREYYLKNRERILKHVKEYHNHPESITKIREWRNKNRERLKQIQIKYYIKNRDKILKRDAGRHRAVIFWE